MKPCCKIIKLFYEYRLLKSIRHHKSNIIVTKKRCCGKTTIITDIAHIYQKDTIIVSGTIKELDNLNTWLQNKKHKIILIDIRVYNFMEYQSLMNRLSYLQSNYNLVIGFINKML